jgi:L-iditol 2-dehydrogenase
MRKFRSNEGALTMGWTYACGSDVVFEVAGAVETPTAAASMCKKGGTLCITGICAADQMAVRHSTARRAGLTIKMVRRMKHTYPRCIDIADKVRDRCYS